MLEAEGPARIFRMIRQALTGRAFSDPHFRHRGHEVTRIEGLTDGVFAFAVTLLVATLEVPHTYAELIHAMRGFLAFAICFAVLFHIWFLHFRFSRRFALQDMTTHILTGVLLFVVLFYVYPLKFLFGLLSDQVFGYASAGLNVSQAGVLLVIYGVGFAAVYGVFLLLNLHALRRREYLELDEVEILATREVVWSCVGSIVVAVASIATALVGPVKYAGWVYFLIGVVQTVNGTYFGRRLSALTPPPAPAPTRAR